MALNLNTLIFMSSELIDINKSILENVEFIPIDYWEIINKYIPSTNKVLYRIYVTHVTLVTQKSLKIAKGLDLKGNQLRFIEEAGMLHDIGIIKVDDKEIGCDGKLPYICHGTEGRKILDEIDLPLHGRVAETHTGVGIFKDEIIKMRLPLPQRDMLPQTVEEEIVSWSDLFFTKDPSKIWFEKNLEDAKASVEEFGDRYTERFDAWAGRYTSLD